ncbi:hypothetical protein ACFWPJ_25890, partial [Nocardia sp. NPDC058497]
MTGVDQPGTAERRPVVGGPIRPASESEIPVLQEIEQLAGAPFAEVGMIAVAEDEPPQADTLREYIAAERAWV